MKKIISFFLHNVPRPYLQYVGHHAARILGIFYSGDNVECPICCRCFGKFLPYGRVGRSNALCPNCLSLERHRLLWLYLKEKTDFFKKTKRMLHIAPEICLQNKMKGMKNLDYTTGDVESPLADIQMDIHKIPFEENSFDVVMASHVLEHVENDIQALREIYRVLKPSGWAILQVPFYSPIPENTFQDPSVSSKKEREKLYGQDDHVRKYGKDYPKRLESAGFEVKEDNFLRELPQDLRKRYALPEHELIYRVFKNA